MIWKEVCIKMIRLGGTIVFHASSFVYTNQAVRTYACGHRWPLRWAWQEGEMAIPRILEVRSISQFNLYCLHWLIENA
jgi:hypothetical protein